MNVMLLKALAALAPTCLLVSGSALLFFRARTACYVLQLIGAGCLLVVALAHLFEALRLFPSMRWGQQDSIGHYLDLWSAALGLTLFPVGYLLQALTKVTHRPRQGERERA